MKINKYKKHIQSWNDDQRKEIGQLLLDSIEKNDHRVIIVSKSIIITIVAYYLLKHNLTDSVSFLGLSIKSKELLLSVIPSILSILSFLYINIQFRKQDLRFFYDRYIISRYNLNEQRDMKVSWLTKILTPIASGEIIYIYPKKWSFLNLPMALTIMVIYTTPFLVLYDGIKHLCNSSDKSYTDWFLIVLPIVVTTYSALLFFKIIWDGIMDNINDDLKQP